jgi:hypothetical protein
MLLSKPALVAVALAVALAASLAAAVTTKIAAGEMLCVTERAEKDTTLSFSYRVTAGGKLDLDVEIFDSTGASIQQWPLASQGSYNLRGDTVNNNFKFCFSNKMARWTPKWVSFFLHPGLHPAIAPRERVDPIEAQILQLSGKMSALRDAHDDLRVSEHDHRNTLEDVNERVLLWNVIQTVVLVVLGVVQVFFIKRFLEVRSTV